jgi:integrase
MRLVCADSAELVRLVRPVWEHRGNMKAVRCASVVEYPEADLEGSMRSQTIRPSGHLQVKGTRGNRAFYALIRDAEGRHQRKLGAAWVKDSGKRTTRGAVKWIARDGAKPDGYLTPADAEAMLQEMLAAASRKAATHTVARGTHLTMRGACDEWLRWAGNDREVKPSTLGDYRDVCNRVCRDFGDEIPVRAITTEHLQHWIDGFLAERRLSPAEANRRRGQDAQLRRMPDGSYLQLTPASSRTKRKYLVNLNGILKRAIKLGAIDSNPVALVERPGRLRKRNTLATTRFLRPAEVHVLVKAAAEVNGQDAVMFQLSAFCGLRLGELLDLRWGAVDIARAALHVESSYVRNIEGTPKSHAARTVPVAREVAEALEKHGAGVPLRPAEGLVFLGKQGSHVDAKALRRRYYQALDRGGVKRVRIHDLRHTFGTVCAANGIPLTTIKEWMGHADLATTEIYTAFYPQNSDAAKISAAFADKSSSPAVRLAA